MRVVVTILLYVLTPTLAMARHSSENKKLNVIAQYYLQPGTECELARSSTAIAKDVDSSR